MQVLAYCPAAVFMCCILYLRFFFLLFDGPFSDMTETITEGPCAGIHTRADHAEEYERMISGLGL